MVGELLGAAVVVVAVVVGVLEEVVVVLEVVGVSVVPSDSADNTVRLAWIKIGTGNTGVRVL